MDSYFDIKALPNPEIIQSAVIGHLMQALHKLLPTFQGRLGIDFPAYGQQKTLGGIIRLLGTKEDIKNLREQVKQTAVFNDYAFITEHSAVPESINKYAIYKRKHAKGNSRFRRIKKRHEAEGRWTDDLAQAVSEKFKLPVHLPHVCLSSASTDQQQFMIFIKEKFTLNAHTGKFNAYGLSLDGATVPKF